MGGIKKKTDNQLSHAFPEYFESTIANGAYYESLKRRAKALVRLTLDEDESALTMLRQIEQELQTFLPEQLVFDTENSEDFGRKFELGFEKLVAAMEDQGCQGAGQLSTYAFYARLRYFEDKNLNLKNRSGND